MHAFVDIETSNLNADFGEVLCAVIKPERGKLVVFRADEYTGSSTDLGMLVDLRTALEEYVDGGVWVTWYGKRFDIPFLDARLLFHHERPIRKAMHEDLFYIAKFRLVLSSRRLDSVARHLQTKTQKTRLEPRLWLSALRGEKGAMDEVVEHCKLDVKVLSEVYEKLKPYIDTLRRKHAV